MVQATEQALLDRHDMDPSGLEVHAQTRFQCGYDVLHHSILFVAGTGIFYKIVAQTVIDQGHKTIRHLTVRSTGLLEIVENQTENGRDFVGASIRIQSIKWE
jgi:hypothetical protein